MKKTNNFQFYSVLFFSFLILCLFFQFPIEGNPFAAKIHKKKQVKLEHGKIVYKGYIETQGQKFAIIEFDFHEHLLRKDESYQSYKVRKIKPFELDVEYRGIRMHIPMLKFLKKSVQKKKQK